MRADISWLCKVADVTQHLSTQQPSSLLCCVANSLIKLQVEHESW